MSKITKVVEPSPHGTSDRENETTHSTLMHMRSIIDVPFMHILKNILTYHPSTTTGTNWR